MKHVFISGIPASGKSYLAEKISKNLGILHVDMDDLREEMSKDPELKKWVEFFSSQDEGEYWDKTDCEQQYENLKKQSEAFWPTFQEKIDEIISSGQSAIFEGVNILPHLTSKRPNFPGVYLVSDSIEDIFVRNQIDPRWGKTKELQRREAEAFVNCEAKMYEQEAGKYGYKVFRDPKEAKEEIIKLLKS
jgi:shikimate kinase